MVGSSMVFFGSSIMKTLVGVSKKEIADRCVHMNLLLGSMCLIINGSLYIYQSI